jgi:primosomal protein N' (replication factor Y) (superfamily II helicase)
MLVAKVLIDGPRELLFDYAVPGELADAVRAGSRVRIPLGPRRATGTVTAVRAVTEADGTTAFELKPLLGVIAGQAGVAPALLRLAQWLADYYVAPLEQVMRSLLPVSVRAEATGFRTRKVVRLAAPWTDELEAAAAALAVRAPRQAEVLARLREGSGGDGRPLADFPAAAIKALEGKGLVRVEDETVARDPQASETDDHVPSQPLALNEAQAAAVAAATAAIDDPAAARPILLFGVTGSGKTEVYLQAVQHALERGATALVLVPEISLTPQTVERFRNRFAGTSAGVAVLHSHLADGERHDEWHRIARSGARIVIGARSAVFAPLEKLGLIIVDEEHEASYKQDTVPRYHGRDVAVMRAHLEGCAVLLGSATPSLESWRNTQTGKYRLLTLPQRIDDRRLPLVRVVDMRTEKPAVKGAPMILSEPLRIAIDARLQRSEQVILFLNRRGYAGAVQCPSCGHVVHCPHCSVSLVYHKTEDKLLCHLCGHRRLPLRTCPECHEPSIRLAGYGTQRVEETLRRVFPSARLARVDTDTMGRKHELRDTLAAFKARRLDLLIGTQMIAKGLDFPGVTLVGVLHADLGLHIPDFRAGERTFQLLTQVAGRAGRGDLSGEVIIQTYAPHHPAIQYARHTDFTGFAEQEMEMRHALGFPPYGHVLLLTTRSENDELAKFTLETVHRRLAKDPPAGVVVNEPAPSPLQRADKHFRHQLLLQAPASRRLTTHLRAVLAGLTFPREVYLVVDVDPYSLA